MFNNRAMVCKKCGICKTIFKKINMVICHAFELTAINTLNSPNVDM
jgi:hypothetical protein